MIKTLFGHYSESKQFWFRLRNLLTRHFTYTTTQVKKFEKSLGSNLDLDPCLKSGQRCDLNWSEIRMKIPVLYFQLNLDLSNYTKIYTKGSYLR